jgi:hypothetical protein
MGADVNVGDLESRPRGSRSDSGLREERAGEKGEGQDRECLLHSRDHLGRQEFESWTHGEAGRHSIFLRLFVPCRSHAALVFGGDFVDVVDDEGFDGDFLRHELEAELFLHGGEEVG